MTPEESRREGNRRGGINLWANLTKKQRREKARKMARARWAKQKSAQRAA